MRSGKDRKFRVTVRFREGRFKFLRGLIVSVKSRDFYALYVQQPRCSNMHYLKHRCLVSSTSSGVVLMFRVNRRLFRVFSNAGLFFGFYKSSW